MISKHTKLALKKLPGRVYRKYRKLDDGSRVYVETWTVRYQGKDYSTRETEEEKAKNFLRKLIGGDNSEKNKPWKAAIHAAQAPASGVLLSRILDLFVADSELRELASAPGNKGMVTNYLKPFFGDTVVTDLSTEMLNNYKISRLAAVPKPANGSVNRELAALKRALNYCKDEHQPALLTHYPKITMLKEATPRKGFLVHRDYVRLRHALAEYWEPVFVTAYHVGRRRGELLQIEIDDVDLRCKNPHIRVYGDATKNGEPSLLPVYGDMRTTIEKQIEFTRANFPACKLLFHKNGEFIHKNQTFYDEWNERCAVAGLPGLLFHDLRRTACRNLIRAGNSRKEAMRISGHKTESAFERYHIVDEGDTVEASLKMERYLAAQQASLETEVARVY